MKSLLLLVFCVAQHVDCIPRSTATFVTHHKKTKRTKLLLKMSSSDTHKQKPHIEKEVTVGSTKWISLKTLSYKDETGRDRQWVRHSIITSI